MQYAVVSGTVVASQKVDSLRGLSLKILSVCSQGKQFTGETIVAIDSLGARPGDFVLWVGKREASMAVPKGHDAGGPAVKNSYPVDAAITGIVDAIS